MGKLKKWRVGVPALALACSLVTLAATSASAHDNDDRGARRRDDTAFTFAVIGDVPYGDAQVALFPGRIDEINADRDVELVNHVGDIKSGSSECTDDYFAMVKSQFDRFHDPLVYTPGDNEWTDCHRLNNGGYDPLERLDVLRDVFFPVPGRTLGRRSARVDSQADQGYPENVSFRRSDVSFGAVHIVGSNNSLAPWTGASAPNPAQAAEVLGRTAAGIELIRHTFREARANRDRTVVLLMQADMFDPTVSAPTFQNSYAFQPVVRAIAQEAAHFNGPVWLFDGDSHVYNQDRPLAAGSKWIDFYKLASPTPNLARVTVEGSSDLDEWVKASVDKRGALTLRRVPFTTL